MMTVKRIAAVGMLCAGTSAFAAIDAGLVEYWDMDGDFAAFVDGTHAGTLTTTGTGSGTFAAGKFGSAIDLENSTGNQAYIVVGGNENDFDFAGSDMSISMWYTTESLYTQWQALAAKGEGGAWRLHRSSNSGTLLNFSGGGNFNGDGELEQQSGSWHHVVITHEDGVVTRMYVDGSLVGSNPSAGSITANSAAMQIGGNPGASGRGWDGKLDDVAVWNRVLTTDEIADLYNGGDGATVASLIPEPSSLALLTMGTLLIARRRRG